MHIDGRNKNILFLGERSTQGLDNATITGETKHPINFTGSGKQFVLSLHYNESNNVFICQLKMYQFRAKDSEIKPYLLCLGNISKDFTLDNMKKNRIKRICESFFC